MNFKYVFTYINVARGSFRNNHQYNSPVSQLMCNNVLYVCSRLIFMAFDSGQSNFIFWKIKNAWLSCEALWLIGRTSRRSWLLQPSLQRYHSTTWTEMWMGICHTQQHPFLPARPAARKQALNPRLSRWSCGRGRDAYHISVSVVVWTI